ncbi:glutamate-rich protein 3 [Latimeria chalumnae]|uniref:glutamate-rich protein 3 n=1 Tax=Latimeria chalumnae TaxID=7897 RepID=UPI0003C18F40|nr:PREDICTED: glutamate-rich protein 3 isoform X2 [Latimeria chalumnae]|eukprot:XP_006003352.1 PREDICTED: glutamate-rich protein 3 isoform X2 [Latimeria chalumnae]
MSHPHPGPLATYNSLTDKHLTGYFNNTRIRRHLQRAGLITRSGKIISEKQYRLNAVRRDHQRYVRECLAQAIFHKVLDMERHHHLEIKKRLQDFARKERAQRIKVERSKRCDEDVIPLLSPRPPTGPRNTHGHFLGPNGDQADSSASPSSTRPNTAPGKMQRPVRLQPLHSNDTVGSAKRTSPGSRNKNPAVNDLDHRLAYGFDRGNMRHMTMVDFSNEMSPYRLPVINNYVTPIPPPPKKHDRSLKRTPNGTGRRRLRPTTAPYELAETSAMESVRFHKTSVHSNVAITMTYFGKAVHLFHDDFDYSDEVKIYQQHCGGENLCVYKGRLLEGENFNFVSRRHRGFPFSLTFFLNGIQVDRVSSCCEFKHKKGSRLGGKHGHFGFFDVEGACPCYRCIIALGLDKKPIPPKKMKEEDEEQEEAERKEELLKEAPSESLENIVDEDKNKEESTLTSSSTFEENNVEEDMMVVKEEIIVDGEENETKGETHEDCSKQEYEEDFEVDEEKPSNGADERGSTEHDVNGRSQTASDDEKDDSDNEKESNKSKQKEQAQSESEEDERASYTDSESEEEDKPDDRKLGSSVSSRSTLYSSKSSGEESEEEEIARSSSTGQLAEPENHAKLANCSEPMSNVMEIEEVIKAEESVTENEKELEAGTTNGEMHLKDEESNKEQTAEKITERTVKVMEEESIHEQTEREMEKESEHSVTMEDNVNHIQEDSAQMPLDHNAPEIKSEEHHEMGEGMDKSDKTSGENQSKHMESQEEDTEVSEEPHINQTELNSNTSQVGAVSGLEIKLENAKNNRDAQADTQFENLARDNEFNEDGTTDHINVFEKNRTAESETDTETEEEEESLESHTEKNNYQGKDEKAKDGETLSESKGDGYDIGPELDFKEKRNKKYEEDNTTMSEAIEDNRSSPSMSPFEVTDDVVKKDVQDVEGKTVETETYSETKQEVMQDTLDDIRRETEVDLETEVKESRSMDNTGESEIETKVEKESSRDNSEQLEEKIKTEEAECIEKVKFEKDEHELNAQIEEDYSESEENRLEPEDQLKTSSELQEVKPEAIFEEVGSEELVEKGSNQLKDDEDQAEEENIKPKAVTELEILVDKTRVQYAEADCEVKLDKAAVESVEVLKDTVASAEESWFDPESLAEEDKTELAEEVRSESEFKLQMEDTGVALDVEAKETGAQGTEAHEEARNKLEKINIEATAQVADEESRLESKAEAAEVGSKPNIQAVEEEDRAEAQTNVTEDIGLVFGAQIIEELKPEHKAKDIEEAGAMSEVQASKETGTVPETIVESSLDPRVHEVVEASIVSEVQTAEEAESVPKAKAQVVEEEAMSNSDTHQEVVKSQNQVQAEKEVGLESQTEREPVPEMQTQRNQEAGSEILAKVEITYLNPQLQAEEEKGPGPQDQIEEEAESKTQIEKEPESYPKAEEEAEPEPQAQTEQEPELEILDQVEIPSPQPLAQAEAAGPGSLTQSEVDAGPSPLAQAEEETNQTQIDGAGQSPLTQFEKETVPGLVAQAEGEVGQDPIAQADEGTGPEPQTNAEEDADPETQAQMAEEQSGPEVIDQGKEEEGYTEPPTQTVEEPRPESQAQIAKEEEAAKPELQDQVVKEAGLEHQAFVQEETEKKTQDQTAEMSEPEPQAQESYQLELEDQVAEDVGIQAIAQEEETGLETQAQIVEVSRSVSPTQSEQETRLKLQDQVTTESDLEPQVVETDVSLKNAVELMENNAIEEKEAVSDTMVHETEEIIEATEARIVEAEFERESMSEEGKRLSVSDDEKVEPFKSDDNVLEDTVTVPHSNIEDQEVIQEVNTLIEALSQISENETILETKTEESGTSETDLDSQDVETADNTEQSVTETVVEETTGTDITSETQAMEAHVENLKAMETDSDSEIKGGDINIFADGAAKANMTETEVFSLKGEETSSTINGVEDQTDMMNGNTVNINAGSSNTKEFLETAPTEDA